jgi:peptidylprolyl isomerase
MIATALCALAFAACGEDKDKAEGDKPAKTQDEAAAFKPSGELARKPKVEVPSGPAPKELQKKDLIKGEGPAAKQGDTIRVQYVGVSYKNGKEFDASWNRGEPFELQLGAGMVIPGWDEGIVGMRLGSRRQLVIPPDLAYGPQGSPPAIGPNETLVFVVDLVGIG